MKNLRMQTQNQIEEVNPRHLDPLIHRDEIRIGKVDQWNVKRIVIETKRGQIIKKAREMTGRRAIDERDIINRQILKKIKLIIENIMRDGTEVVQMIDTESVTHLPIPTPIIITARGRNQTKSIQKVVKNLQIITHPMTNGNIKESIRKASIIGIALKINFYFTLSSST
jgi:hypothetical protein